MSKRAFDKIMAGLDSAQRYLDGTADKRCYRVHVREVVREEPQAVSNAPER